MQEHEEQERVREHEEQERVRRHLETLRNLAREAEGFNIRGIGGDDNDDVGNDGDGGDDEVGSSASKDDDEFEDDEFVDEEEDLDLSPVRRVTPLKPKPNPPLGKALKKKQDYFSGAAGLAELKRGKQWYLPENDPVSRSCHTTHPVGGTINRLSLHYHGIDFSPRLLKHYLEA
jgi:hypothetical protein